ncbi:MAG: hypothetical protein OXG81_16860 [Acidobacteria bacterium]|nr:hypothetical protein [Acidobacteriota bacterium]
MSDMERQETGQVPLREWLRSGKWLAGLAGGAIAAPIGIQLHELGHFAVNVACGFPDNVLRYASVSWTGSSEFRRLWRAGDVEAAAAIAEPWQVALSAAAGPIVSYLTAIGFVLWVRRYGPGPLSLVLGSGFVAPLQGVAAIPVIAIDLFGGGFRGNQDEANFAAITGIPASLAVLPGLICLVFGYWFLVTAFPRGQRSRAVGPPLVGVALGIALWGSVLGPQVLP